MLVKFFLGAAFAASTVAAQSPVWRQVCYSFFMNLGEKELI